MHYPEYYRQLENHTFANLARVDNVQGLIRLSFNDSLDAEIFKNKAFAEGRGVVTTDLTEDGKVVVYCREEDFFKEGTGTDVLSAIVEADCSMDEQTQYFARRYAVHHDKQQADKCMEYMRENRSFVIHDGSSKESNYMKYEDKTLTFYSWDSENNIYRSREVEADFENEDAMRKLFEYHVSSIRNERIDTLEDFELFSKTDEQILQRDYLIKQEALYKEIVLPEFAYLGTFEGTKDFFDRPDVQAKIKEYGCENVRPDFSKDFLSRLKTSMESALIPHKEAVQQSKAQEDRFKKYLQTNGVQSVGIKHPVVVKDASLDQIQRGLEEMKEYKENALRDAVTRIYGNMPGSDAKTFLQAYLSKGIAIPFPYKQEELISLIQKETLTPEEEQYLTTCMEKTIFFQAGRTNPEAGRDYTIVTKLESFLHTLDTVKPNDEIRQLQSHIESTEEQIEALDMLLQSEMEHSQSMNTLQNDLRQEVSKLKVANKGIKTGGLINEVKTLMKDKFHAPIDHIEVEYVSFDAFAEKLQRTEKEANTTERDYTEEREM